MHVTLSLGSSPSVFAYCKPSKTEGGNGLLPLPTMAYSRWSHGLQHMVIWPTACGHMTLIPPPSTPTWLTAYGHMTLIPPPSTPTWLTAYGHMTLIPPPATPPWLTAYGHRDYCPCSYGLQYRTYSVNIRPVLIISLDAFISPLQDAVLMNKLWETDGQKSTPTMLICLRTLKS